MLTRHFFHRIGVGLSLVWLSASCAQSPEQDPAAALTNIPVLLTDVEQRLALLDEREANYLEAYTYWSQAEQLLNRKLTQLSQELQRSSQVHLRKGVSLFEAGQHQRALEEVVTSLRYYPANQAALDFLKAKYRPGSYLPYTVQDSDTPAAIAEKMYGSTSYSFLVIHFSEAGDKGLTAGQEIGLVQLDSFQPRERLGYNRDILVARKLFKAGDFSSVLPLARNLLEEHPGDQEASYIINMSLLGIARNQQEQEQFEEAITTLTQVDPAFKKVNRQIQTIRGLQLEKQLEQAEFSDDKLLQMAEDLYDQGNYLKARTVLEQTGQDFPGRDTAFARIQAKLDQKAEYHYKKGVKYFVDEKLEEAISEWQETLRLNPEHRNGRISLKQARDLLDKYKKIN
jgi:tetratricopeptide (TPR) repeat protein